MTQLIVHLWGDYILQSGWMADNKTKAHLPAFVHALLYSLAFLVFHPSPAAWATIFVTHFFIDRYRLARYVVWAKNWLAPIGDLPAGGPSFVSMIRKGQCYYNLPFSYCAKTGYDELVPDWLAVWLLIIADNTLHLTINYLALRYL